MGFLSSERSNPEIVTKSVGQPFEAGFLPSLGSVSSATGLAISQSTAMGISTVWACIQDLSKSLARCTRDPAFEERRPWRRTCD